MTEQQRRSLFFSATGKVATLNPFEYFIFCKGMDVEREACAKVCEAVEVPDVIYGAHPDYLEGKLMAISQAATAIRARGQSKPETLSPAEHRRRTNAPWNDKASY